MKRIILITILYLLLLVGITCFLQPSQSNPSADFSGLMGTSNQLYEMGEFSLAAQGYQQLIDQGFSDAALFYNLGNAFYKQNDYGRAILNYLRARRLAPRDADIRANLKMAYNMRVDRLDQNASGGLYNSFTQFIQEWLTLNELAIISISLWYLLSLLVIIFFNSKPGSRTREVITYITLLVVILFMTAAFSLSSVLVNERTQPQAVIIAEEVNVTSGPGTQYITEFTLHSGSEVNLLETRINWVRLALPGAELQGWAPEEAVEKVTQQ